MYAKGIKILVGQAVFKLWIKTVKIMFGSVLKNRLAYLNFGAFLSSWTSYYKMHILFFKKILITLSREKNMLILR